MDWFLYVIGLRHEKVKIGALLIAAIFNEKTRSIYLFAWLSQMFIDCLRLAVQSIF